MMIRIETTHSLVLIDPAKVCSAHVARNTNQRTTHTTVYVALSDTGEGLGSHVVAIECDSDEEVVEFLDALEEATRDGIPVWLYVFAGIGVGITLVELLKSIIL